MSGFAGFISNNKTNDNETVLNKMLAAIKHRGPDCTKLFTDNNLMLGFCGLDTSDNSSISLKCFSNSSTTVVLDGELTNYRQLYSVLPKQHSSFEYSEAELIARLYELSGISFINSLRGMFSFVIWDKLEENIFAVRDRFGVKPLYYTIIHNQLIFASEIKAILEFPEYKKALNTEALSCYLAFGTSALDETFFKNIYKLMPAHTLSFKNGVLKLSRYWKPHFETNYYKTADEYADELSCGIKSSINAIKSNNQDSNIIPILNNNTDAAIIAALSESDDCCFAGFDYDRYKNLETVRILSDKFQQNSHAIMYTTRELWSIFPTIQQFAEEPVSNPLYACSYLNYRYAAYFSKSAFSSDGAIELFGSPYTLTGVFNYDNQFIFNNKESAKLLKKDIIGNTFDISSALIYKKLTHTNSVLRNQYIDINFKLAQNILTIDDKLSMINSLELKLPFLDLDVFEAAMHMPFEYKQNNSASGYTLGITANRYVKQSQKPFRLGANPPVRAWLKDEKYYKLIKTAFCSEAAASLFNTKLLLQLLENHKTGKADNSAKIMTVYMFLLWYNEYFTS